MEQHCKKCTIETGTTGVAFDKEGMCSICNRTEHQKNYEGFKGILKNAIEFEVYIKKHKNKNNYRCMLLYSGGENGAYILNKLIKEDRIKPLVFTLNHPFKSKESISKIQELSSSLNAEHIVFTPDKLLYERAMQYIFMKDQYGVDLTNNTSNKFPCIVCAGFLQIICFMFAYRMGIPYILCVDYEQTSLLPVNIFKLVDKLSDILGEELLLEVLGEDLTELLRIREIEVVGPKIVYPFASMGEISYDKIASKLKEEGLYELSRSNSSCRLSPLLDYYSYRKFGYNYYAFEVAQKVRDGICDREKEVEFLKEYKKIIMDVTRLKKIDEIYMLDIRDILDKHRKQSKYVFEGSHDDIASIWNTAKELGIDLLGM